MIQGQKFQTTNQPIPALVVPQVLQTPLHVEDWQVSAANHHHHHHHAAREDPAANAHDWFPGLGDLCRGCTVVCAFCTVLLAVAK